MERTDLHELSAAYALDALDADDRRAFEAHLGGCERCRNDLADFSYTAGLLAYGTPSTAPPASLRARVLDEVRRERQVVVPLRRPRFVLGAATGLAAAAAVALAFWVVSLSGELDRSRAALDVLADPAARSIELEGAAGRLVVDAEGQAALVVRDLAAAPAGKTYEVWVIQGDAPRRAGLFEGRAARDLVLLDRPVPDDAVVAVTLEQDGGVDAPTGAPLFSAST
ncbi:MAG: anti-sigma factor [Gaiellaceae bacterium]